MKKNLTLIFSAFLLSMSAYAQTAEQIVDNYEAKAIAGNVEYKFAQTINDDLNQRVYTQRTFQGIPIYNSYSTYIIKDKQVISKTSSENFNISLKNADISPSLNFNDALNKVAQSEGLKFFSDSKIDQNGVYFSKDDSFIICSDGVHNVMTLELLRLLLSEENGKEKIEEYLGEHAVDNFSLININA